MILLIETESDISVFGAIIKLDKLFSVEKESVLSKDKGANIIISFKISHG